MRSMCGQRFENHHATQGLPIVRLEELGKDLDSERGTPAEGWDTICMGPNTTYNAIESSQGLAATDNTDP